MVTHKPRPDPIRDYVEWTEHRYDPGYYLGGNAPPYLRTASLGPRARRRAAVLVAILALSGSAAVIRTVNLGSPAQLLLGCVAVILAALAAIKLYRGALLIHSGVRLLQIVLQRCEGSAIYQGRFARQDNL